MDGEPTGAQTSGRATRLMTAASLGRPGDYGGRVRPTGLRMRTYGTIARMMATSVRDVQSLRVRTDRVLFLLGLVRLGAPRVHDMSWVKPWGASIAGPQRAQMATTDVIGVHACSTDTWAQA
jgi:hypothetical protein